MCFIVCVNAWQQSRNYVRGLSGQRGGQNLQGILFLLTRANQAVTRGCIVFLAIIYKIKLTSTISFTSMS